jgi:Xaa-Pro aminopeptidase
MVFSFLKKKSFIPTTDFSRFFVLSKADEKKKMLKEIVKKANEDQMALYSSI